MLNLNDSFGGPNPTNSTDRRRTSGIVKGFRMPARHRREGCTAAGVRKASREETAGEIATAVVSIYGDLALVLDLICRFRTGPRVESAAGRWFWPPWMRSAQ
jgi:hypothetical protein